MLSSLDRSSSLITDHAPRVEERLRVLIVDDDPAQLRSTRRTLRGERERLELTVAESGIDALIQVGATMPDLVVMDVFMPGLNGVEACRRLKANPATAHTKVVLASVALTPELIASAREAGADATIAKPFDAAQLLELAAGPDESAVPTPASEGRLARGTVPMPMVAREPGGAAQDARAALGDGTKEVVAPQRAADVLVGLLADAGVDVVFGLPGGAISPVHDALLDSDIEIVTTRHESGAMFAAAGYARTTGKLGVVAVTSGPGALNALTGLASAHCDGLPVLLLVGEVPRHAHGKGVLQDGSSHGLQIVEMARHVSKLALEVPDGRQLPHLLRRAISTALSGRRGPVVLSLPMDVTTARITPPTLAGTISVESSIDPSTLDEVIELIDGAQRPLLLVGSGLLGGAAPALLRELVHRTGCPVATTPKGKSVFPDTDPHALGVLGLGGHPSAHAYLKQGVDVLVAIGTSLGDLATDGFSPLLQAGRAMVHVDIDARQIGKSYSPTLAIVASGETFLGGLLRRMPATLQPRPAPGGIVRHVLTSSTTAVAPHDVLREMQAILPRDTIYTADSGEHMVFATHFLELAHPDSYIVMTGLGSMGQSIGAALGAQLAHPGRTVAAIVGDGCFAMNAFEVATAVQAKLPIRVFVFNDGRYTMVENGHEVVYGRRPEYLSVPMDAATIAHGLGATVLRIERAGELAAHADLLRNHAGPVVIDVRIDHTIKLPKKDRIGAFAPKPCKPAVKLN